MEPQLILVESDTFVPFVSKNVVCVSDISAVNLIVGWKLFACRRNSYISLLPVSHTDMTSSKNLVQKMGLMLLCLSISFSILAMKMLAKATAIFVPMAQIEITKHMFCVLRCRRGRVSAF